MKRVTAEIKIKMVLDVDDNQDLDEVLDNIEFTEIDIIDGANLVACNIIEKKIYNFFK